MTTWRGWRPSWTWRAAARLLLVGQAAGFAFMVAGTHGAFGPQPVPPTTTDFASFYAAGVLANRATPDLAYDQAAHGAVESQVVAPGVEEKPFVNPPVFLLLCAPLARLPYLVAFLAFEGVTFAAWLVLGTRIAGGGALAAIALAACPPAWWALGWGQNSFLSASLLAAGTLLLPRRPLLAGAAFGALCFKPHLAMLVPVALVAGGFGRATLAAAASAAALVAVSALCFGLSTWQAFLSVAMHTHPARGGHALAAHVDFYSAATLLGASSGTATAVQAAATGLSALSVAWLWRRARGGKADGDRALANAGLIAGTLVAAPFLLFYDLAIAGLAACWIARHARRQGWTRAELFALAASTGFGLVAYPSAILMHAALGSLVPLALLSVVLRRATSHPLRRSDRQVGVLVTSID